VSREAERTREDPAARAVRAFFRWPVRLSRWFGSLPPPRERRGVEGPGLSGSVNLCVAGAGDWHFVLRGERVAVKEGVAPDARATIRLSAADFVAMLAGRLAVSTAQMTGRVRLSGDGEMLFLLGVLVTQFQHARSAQGLRGWPARRFTRYVLRGTLARPEPAGGPR
jgi:putative sterol carrier protein